MALPAVPGRNLDADLAYASELARADLLPDAYRGKPGNVLLAVEYGRMLDVSPLVAIQHVHVINGRLGLSSEMMRAKVRAAGHRLRVTDHTPTEATVELTTSDDPDHTTVVTYTLDDARTAGALDVWWERWVTDKGTGRKRKETWVAPDGTTPATDPHDLVAAERAPEWILDATPKRNENWWRHPAAMLVARATSAAVRAACPEVLMGLDSVADLETSPTAWAPPPAADTVDLDGPTDHDDDDPPADSGQYDRISELARQLDEDQAAAASVWREQRGYQWPTLTRSEADDILGYLDHVLQPATP